MPKGGPRALGADEMFAAKWEYENTPISQGGLAHRYGISQPAVWKYSSTGGWKKVAKKRQKRYPDTPEGHAAYQADLIAAMQVEYDRRLVDGLSAELAATVPRTDPAVVQQVVQDIQTKADMRLAHWEKRHPRKTGRHKWPLAKPAPAGTSPAPEAASDDDENPDPAPAAKKRGRKRRGDHGRGKSNYGTSGGEVVAFPGGYTSPPPPRPIPTVVPQLPERAEHAALNLQMAGMRGELTVQQARQLDAVDRVLDEYGHLISVFLNPHRYVSEEGLTEDQLKEKLRDTSVAAARILLPTERDTLNNAVTAFTRAKISIINTKREVVGLGGKKGGGDDKPPEPGSAAAETAELLNLDVGSLRQVRDAMQVLTGQIQSRQEPPKPPPPDGIADLKPPAVEETPPKPPPPI